MQADDKKLLQCLKALGHPTRLAIVRELAARQGCGCGCGECGCEDCPGEGCTCGCRCGLLVEKFDMPQSTLSQHIKELTNAELIKKSSRKGNYTLNHSKISEGLILLLDLLGYKTDLKMEEKKCTCGDECKCGPDCQCGPDCKCCEGGECTCGPDCKCREGGECTCGDECKCN